MRIEDLVLILLGAGFCAFGLYLVAQVPHVRKDQKKYNMAATATVTGNIQDTNSWMYHPVVSFYANGTTHVVTCKKGFTKPKAEGASINILYIGSNPDEIRIAERASALKFCLALAFFILIGLKFILIGIARP